MFILNVIEKELDKAIVRIQRLDKNNEFIINSGVASIEKLGQLGEKELEILVKYASKGTKQVIDHQYLRGFINTFIADKIAMNLRKKLESL